MPNYRRAFVPGGSFFFTLVTNRRARLFSEPRGRILLGSMFRRCQLKWPFTINALVLLPEHLHAIWSLPPGDDEYPKRWGWIKKEFTKEWLSRDWPWSSFHRWVKAGVYPNHWACSRRGFVMDFRDIEDSVGEPQ